VSDRPEFDADIDALITRAYCTVLGRSPERDGLTSARDALKRGAVGRFEFVRNLVASQEFAELVTMEELTRAALASGRAFDPDQPFGGPRASERVVEVPWVLSRYRGERRVLDVGYANAPAAYLTLLLGLGVEQLHCVDLAVRPMVGANAARADVRLLPYRDGAFSLVLCVSTLEHIGLDNTRYAPFTERAAEDGVAMAEIGRVLAPGGRLMVTVPVGRQEDHGWFHQYDLAEWARLLHRGPYETEEQSTFRVTPHGWVREHELDSLAELRYGSAGGGARAVLCCSLVRRRG
jgi:SAM-dependent methyltransferase